MVNGLAEKDAGSTPEFPWLDSFPESVKLAL
jgi:hypothetical protein